MTRHIAPAIAALALSLTSCAHPVLAQSIQNCGPKEIVSSRLAERYGETRQARGIASNNAILEVFASVDTGTWTMVTTSTEGKSCLIASGTDFENLSEHLPPSGEKL